jgi:Cu2+-exporting ATPase
MEQMTHAAHGATPDPMLHKISGAHGSHERRPGHSVAMIRDKFWLSFAFTVPVIFWSVPSSEFARLPQQV